MPAPMPAQLSVIENVALPQNYRFTVNGGSRELYNRTVIEVVSGIHSITIPLWKHGVIHESGFTELLYNLLHFAKQKSLWGQTVICYANYSQTSGVILAATRSGPQPLTLPASPILVNHPNKLQGVAGLNLLSTNPPLGLRMLWGLALLPMSTQVGGNWYIDAANRLLGQDSNLAFDRISFWLAALGVPIKNSQNIATAEALAFRLGADKPSGNLPMCGPLSEILANAGPSGISLQHSMLWTPLRVVMFRVGSPNGFCEFSSAGYSDYSLAEWPGKEQLSTVWNVRKLPPISAAYTTASLV